MNGTYNEPRGTNSLGNGAGAGVGGAGSGILKYSNSSSIAFRLISFAGSCRVLYRRERMT